MDFEQKLHALQMEADGIAAITAAVDNSLAEFDENETATAMTVLTKLSKDHADNIQEIIAMMDRGEAANET